MEFLIVLLLLVLIFVVIFRREIDFLVDLAVTLGVIAFLGWALWTFVPNLTSIIGSVLTGLGVYWWMQDRKKKRRQRAQQEEG